MLHLGHLFNTQGLQLLMNLELAELECAVKSAKLI